jgi:hypothetical protein
VHVQLVLDHLVNKILSFPNRYVQFSLCRVHIGVIKCSRHSPVQNELVGVRAFSTAAPLISLQRFHHLKWIVSSQARHILGVIVLIRNPSCHELYRDPVDWLLY